MKLAVANQLSVQDLSVTPGPAQYGGGGGDIANNNPNACDDVQSAIVTLTDIVTAQITAGNLSALPAETSYIAGLAKRNVVEILVSLLTQLHLTYSVWVMFTHIDLQQSSLLMRQHLSSHSTQQYTTRTSTKLVT